MGTRSDASVLWVRALFAGSFAFFLGTAGHLMADGLLPGTAFLVVLYAFTVALGVPVLVRPASRLRLLGLLVGGQTFIHLCLTLTAGHRGDPKAPPATAPRNTGFADAPGRRRPLASARCRTPSSAPARSPPPRHPCPIHHLVADLSAHAPMMVAHLAARGHWSPCGSRTASGASSPCWR
jgi:hypothetical protein